jgi:aminoglycoside phosphotransferase (APT) family kinase protein
MEHVDGVVPADAETVAAHFDRSARRQMAFALVDVLADLHRIDPDAVGLGQLGRKEDYVARQLRRWERQWQESKTRSLPLIEETHRALADSIPDQQRAAIVHGDYRLDNAIFSPEGEIRAVLDWELCTLGDPLADLGGVIVSWVEEGEPGDHMLSDPPSAAAGVPGREEIVRRYAERSGLDLALLDFYVAFAFWKLACIGEGVYARYRAGVMGEDGLEAERVRDQVDRLAEAAAATLASR